MTELRLFLNRVTMYQLMLYYLRILYGTAVVFSFFDILPYNPITLLVQLGYLLIICYISNQAFAALFKVKPNYESQFITAEILALILGPVILPQGLPLLTVAGIAAMGSKYFLTLSKRHIFNPAAFGAVAAALIVGQSASWWVGTIALFPVVLLGGLVIVQKLKRYTLILSFLGTYSALSAILLLAQGAPATGLPQFLATALTASPLLFFSFVMLVEPLTTPVGSFAKAWYGVGTAVILVLYQTIFPQIGYSLELSLLTANFAIRTMQNQPRYRLQFKKKEEFAPGIIGFYFEPVKPFSFQAGQFLHWWLPHPKPDSRGARRFFTIASSPTEKEILLTTKFSDKPSTFKTALKALKPGTELAAVQLDGDFTLPPDTNQHCVFIAGGIGITPFRSMTRYLLDTKRRQPVTLLYSARSPHEFVFKDVFSEAEKALDSKLVYLVSEPSEGWKGRVGMIDETVIKEAVKDYQKALFYISGPQPMVEAIMKLLRQMRIPEAQIKHDFFPGYDKV